jgi:hypothetical protein
MNFTRGKQVVIHNSTYQSKSGVQYNSPNAFASWKVWPGDHVKQVMGDIAALASAVGKLDAIHFISHGAPGYFELGAENISMGNVETFLPLQNAARNIIIWACQVGGDITPGAQSNPTSLGCAIAQLTNAKVVVGKRNQAYNWGFGASMGQNGLVTINPNFFWEEIYLCQPGGGHLVVFKDSRTDKAQINIEPYLFPNGNN